MERFKSCSTVGLQAMISNVASDTVEQQFTIDDPLVSEIADRIFHARQTTLTEWD
jgi:hypothetical protein